MNSDENLEWGPDILGEGYQNTRIPLGEDPDGEGEIAAVLVRHLSGATHPKAVLYLHGMTDYFFQTHVAEFFAEQGYDFYALDSRKCGRAHRDEQTWHYISDIRMYFEELDRALAIILRDHDEVVVSGHSTGGLIVALWLDHLRREDRASFEHITGAILNSPWLDLQVRPATALVGIPAILAIGKRRPKMLMPGGSLNTYGESIHVSHHGEWDFNLRFKPLSGHQKYFGWLRSVLLGQRALHKGKVDMGVPALTLCSDTSILNEAFSPDSHSADVVLDVEQIRRWAPTLARRVTVETIPGARHDVFLSTHAIREEALRACSRWLRSL